MISRFCQAGLLLQEKTTRPGSSCKVRMQIDASESKVMTVECRNESSIRVHAWATQENLMHIVLLTRVAQSISERRRHALTKNNKHVSRSSPIPRTLTLDRSPELTLFKG